MSYKLPGGNYNGRGIVHLPHEICRTIIGGGGHGGYHAGNEPKVIVPYESVFNRSQPGEKPRASDRPSGGHPD